MALLMFWHIDEGAYALVGESGSGKTTVIRAIAGLAPAQMELSSIMAGISEVCLTQNAAFKKRDQLDVPRPCEIAVAPPDYSESYYRAVSDTGYERPGH